MRFMLIRKADKSTEEGALPSQRLLTEMLNYMGEMGKEGILLAGEGLQPGSKGSASNSRKPSTGSRAGPCAMPTAMSKSKTAVRSRRLRR